MARGWVRTQVAGIAGEVSKKGSEVASAAKPYLDQVAHPWIAHLRVCGSNGSCCWDTGFLWAARAATTN
jgi:hypothetical protein